MQIYYINLDRSIDRLIKFQQRNAHLDDAVRFPAIDGHALDREKLIEEGLIARDCGYTAGSLGCSLSHVGLWKMAIAQNRAITVMEDDAIVSFQFHDLSARLISTAPEDWDFILWGYRFKPSFVWLDFGFSKANVRFYDRRFGEEEQLEFQPAAFSPSLFKLAPAFGLQSYSVSPKGARLLLDYCLPLRNRIIEFPGADVAVEDIVIDIAMCGAYSAMQAFICLPPLAISDDAQISDRGAPAGPGGSLAGG